MRNSAAFSNLTQSQNAYWHFDRTSDGPGYCDPPGNSGSSATRQKQVAVESTTACSLNARHPGGAVGAASDHGASGKVNSNWVSLMQIKCTGAARNYFAFGHCIRAVSTKGNSKWINF